MQRLCTLSKYQFQLDNPGCHLYGMVRNIKVLSVNWAAALLDREALFVLAGC